MQAFESKDERWGKSEQTETFECVICHLCGFICFLKPLGAITVDSFFYLNVFYSN